MRPSATVTSSSSLSSSWLFIQPRLEIFLAIDRCIVVLTADHGYAANRIMEKNFLRYENKDGWIEKVVDTDIHLDHGALAERRILPVKALAVLKDSLRLLRAA